VEVTVTNLPKLEAGEDAAADQAEWDAMLDRLEQTCERITGKLRRALADIERAAIARSVDDAP
jgi:hypothetical protein